MRFSFEIELWSATCEECKLVNTQLSPNGSMASEISATSPVRRDTVALWHGHNYDVVHLLIIINILLDT